MTKLEPPTWLTDDAKEIFVKTVKQLGTIAIATDESLISDFSQAQADVIRLQKAVEFEGDVVISAKTGCPYVNPTLSILITRRKDVERCRHDLGFTPRSRGATVKTTSNSALKSAMEAS